MKRIITNDVSVKTTSAFQYKVSNIFSLQNMFRHFYTVTSVTKTRHARFKNLSSLRYADI